MQPLHAEKSNGEADSSHPAERRRLRRAVAVCIWLYFLVVLAAWGAIYAGDQWWPATLLLFGPRWLLAIPLLALGLAAVRRQRRSLAVVLLALILILGPIMGFQVPWSAAVSTAPPGERLRVLTCNIHYHKPNRAALVRLLAATEPDIVAVQELPSSEPFDYFPNHQWYVHRIRRLFLASRYPIREAVLVGSESMKAPGLIVRYELDATDGSITLFSLHLASPRDGLYQTIHHPSTGIAELEENSTVRRQQSEQLARLADEAPGPVLLMGDFNTPSESTVFRHVWGHYSDAFAKAGWGWGYTFVGGKTAVRIDHILAGPGWHCERCWVGATIGSPHRPVLADLILSELRTSR